MTIHLAIAFDQNYLSPFYALLMSVVEHNKNNKVVIHAIVTGVADGERRTIKSFVQEHGHEIFFYEIDPAVASRFVLVNNWTPAVYYRLFFPFLIPADIKKLLYIDTDVLVVGDLAELYRMDTDGYPVAAVYDNYVKTAPQLGIEAEG